MMNTYYYWAFTYSKKPLAVYGAKQYIRAQELGLPVPNTGRKHWGHFNRRPRNLKVNSERKFTYEEDKEYNFKRIKKNTKFL